MTREEAKIFLYSISGDLGCIDVENYTCKDGEKMREAIQALEQEPILDKIRAEIEHEREEAYKMLGSELGFDKIAAYDKCIGIIDRHLQEAQE